MAIADIKAKLKNYKYKDTAAEHIYEVITQFPFLKLSKQLHSSCAEEAMLNDKCIALVGTVPVHIRGSQYYIPVSIIVTLDYPKESPHVYIKPTQQMELVRSAMVNQYGRVSIAILKHWTSDNNLNDLVNIMSIEFSDQCPVQARSTQAANPSPYRPTPVANPPQPSYSQQGGYLENSLRSTIGGGSSSQQQPSSRYQPPSSMPLQQDSQYYQQLLESERLKHRRELEDERTRAERHLFDKGTLLTQTQQALFREQERADKLQDNVRKLERDLEDIRSQLTEAQQSKQRAEQRARDAQRGIIDKSEQQYWLVGKAEISSQKEQLGTGGWATVRVAKFRHMKVAAKYMHQLIISDYNRELFTREMNMAARMRHPNIVQFIGACMEGELVILTELMPTSLRAQYAKQTLTYPQIIRIGRDVAQGLNYLHLIKPDPIIHRDISSANVLLELLGDSTWRAKICDCGSANFAQMTNTAGPGNPTYAAPESTSPKLQTTKMDVFSYGIVLLETNTQRFPDPRTRELLFDMMGHRQDMTGLIRWCIENEPNDRPSMDDIIVTLDDLEKKYKQR